jgi:hypothetical protein
MPHRVTLDSSSVLPAFAVSAMFCTADELPEVLLTDVETWHVPSAKVLDSHDELSLFFTETLNVTLDSVRLTLLYGSVQVWFACSAKPVNALFAGVKSSRWLLPQLQAPMAECAALRSARLPALPTAPSTAIASERRRAEGRHPAD